MTALVLLLAPPTVAAQPDAVLEPHPEPVLQRTLEALTSSFDGRVGVYVRHLDSGAEAALRPDDLFPTASLVKIPLLLVLYDHIARGDLDPDAALPYPDTLTYRYTERTDVVGYLQPGDSLPLSEIAFLMTSISDNHASLWIQALVGGGAAVNEWLSEHGYHATRVNSRTPGRLAQRETYGWGQTTPREIAEMLVGIRHGHFHPPHLAEEMYRLLTASYWRAAAISQLPPTVQVASKQGFVEDSRSEVLLVNAPGGDYVLAVITDDQRDTRPDRDNDGFRLIRDISRAVYAHFNPEETWAPPRQ